MENAGSYSSLAYDREFIKEMRDKKAKNFKIACIVFPLLSVLGIAIVVIDTKRKGEEMGTAAFASVVWVLIMAVIFMVLFYDYQRGKKKLGQSFVDGTIVLNEKHRRKTKSGYTTVHKIVIQTLEGEEIEVRDTYANPYFQLLQIGDPVRYHPGFIYPIEIYDKEKAGGNVCSFCGNVNNPNESNCKRCGSRMLI